MMMTSELKLPPDPALHILLEGKVRFQRLATVREDHPRGLLRLSVVPDTFTNQKILCCHPPSRLIFKGSLPFAGIQYP